MVLPDSHEVSRASWYSGTYVAAFDTTYGAFTLYGQASQPVLLSNRGSTCVGPTTPDARKHPVWADPVSLAATSGISVDFLSFRY